MLSEIGRLTQVEFDGVGKGAAVIEVDEQGGLRL
jgi:hypothetical protein